MLLQFFSEYFVLLQGNQPQCTSWLFLGPSPKTFALEKVVHLEKIPKQISFLLQLSQAYCQYPLPPQISMLPQKLT
jgi:hypothetical protein